MFAVGMGRYAVRIRVDRRITGWREREQSKEKNRRNE